MFKGVWAALVGLLIEDGQLVMVLVLVVANLYRAGLVARARVSSARR